MSSNPFQKATRTQARARVAFAGPAKAGKSFTSLRLAFALAHANGGNGRVAAIDTEHGSLAKYAGENPDGHPFEFDVIDLRSYGPTKYQQLIEAAAKQGYAALVIDSLSHAWEGAGGVMDMIDAKGGKWSAWKDITPQHRAMVDAILAAPIHVICTMRVKTDWIVEEEVDKNGHKKSTPKKVGLATVQRAGMDYEFDLLGRLDNEHVLRVEGSRCAALDGKVVTKPDALFFQPFIDWLGTGRPQEAEAKPEFKPAAEAKTEGKPAETIAKPTEPTKPVDAPKSEAKESKARQSKYERLREYKKLLGMSDEQYKAALAKRGVASAKELDDLQLDELCTKLSTMITARQIFHGDDGKNGHTDTKSAAGTTHPAFDPNANLLPDGKPY
jgi:hypothetical protein